MIRQYLISFAFVSILAATLEADTVVFPKIFENGLGDGASGIGSVGWPASSRGMTIHSSDGFPDEPVLITEMAVRPDRRPVCGRGNGVGVG